MIVPVKFFTDGMFSPGWLRLDHVNTLTTYEDSWYDEKNQEQKGTIASCNAAFGPFSILYDAEFASKWESFVKASGQ